MCGIVGYTGFRDAAQVLIDGLRCLEYRGYDSAGVSIFEEGQIVTEKAAGRLDALVERLHTRPIHGHCGIGHTRWATHGAPSDANAHPHTAPQVALIHNGIIENYLELRSALLAKGYTFDSQTDTEVAAKLLADLYNGDPMDTIRRALELIEGSYAFAIAFADHPDRIYGAKQASPLIAAVGEGENFLLSDISAAIAHTRDFYVLEDGEIVEISPQAITIYDRDLAPLEKPLHTATWTFEQAQKGGYDHFMLKEMYEQPEVLLGTIRPRIKDSLPCFAADGIPEDLFTGCSRVQIVACGTAMYAGLVGKQLIERFARIPVSVECASEFRYNDPIIHRGDLVIVISQSGETADTLAALRLAKAKGARTLGIINVIGSSIARDADHVIYTHAGPEIAVASTKAFTVQMGILYLLAIAFAHQNGTLEEAACRSLTERLLDVPTQIEGALALREQIAAIAGEAITGESAFYIGRGLDLALAYEGSLKLKELSYIHSEAYAAGELKHGPISLVNNGMPIIALATQQQILPKTVSNMKEVKARGAKTLLICKAGQQIDADAYDYRIDIPAVDDVFAPFPAAVALQMLAYYKAVQLGCDVDKPRNLAKSVTVE